MAFRDAMQDFCQEQIAVLQGFLFLGFETPVVNLDAESILAQDVIRDILVCRAKFWNYPFQGPAAVYRRTMCPFGLVRLVLCVLPERIGEVITAQTFLFLLDIVNDMRRNHQVDMQVMGAILCHRTNLVMNGQRIIRVG